MSIVFYHSAEQKRLAIKSREREESRINGKIFTEIILAPDFYLAEDYHQKYYLQQVPELINEFRTLYPATDNFIHSTAAARVNGYLGGYGTLSALHGELDRLGLSIDATKRLRDIIDNNTSYIGCPSS